ncbi:hypothetical protein [Tsukamurella pseudospumae]|uniref:hypothetical protein n=1 Tax=Tsukamurella pseudospumae TaxID=239498 RepID=UPI000B325981|nr:hypothetical protein [Tsukamurella pseudospumae]
MTARDEQRSAVDSALGGGLSWITGRDSVKRGRSALDGALGELISWVTGRGGKKDKTAE